MNIKVRSYNWPDDYESVSKFLISTYKPGGKYPNWLQPRWEYMHYHPNLDRSLLNKVGIWEDNGGVVALTNFEDKLGYAYFSVYPDYSFLKEDMLEYAESTLYATNGVGEKYINVFINDFDKEFEMIAHEKGYCKNEEQPAFESSSRFEISDPFPEIKVPEGFSLKSLADDNDLVKIDRVLWRGFNHPGEPPEGGIEDRKLMQSAPNFNKGLTIVVEEPEGDFVSFSGIWYVPESRIAYIEPVATDPDYRRIGLGKAAVLECIRRCKELGATVAFVESEQQFYLDIGFELSFRRHMWSRSLS
ncbi:MAG: GNAT family N-acetyltransferase [Kosmotoga sp.]|uniref:GNAT family N-acetyltransferase n=1 Tax=Kosmotoga sp. TaxID=1955248 RepID=UPI001D677176|nr:GNAT family N-acetyltransferase [Kosmotoga sp.]MBO8167033.1 GNAT family N-acetyltransferase [Kosmotoga sp.]